MNRKLLLLLAGLLALGAVVLPTPSYTSKYGGNQSALSQVQDIARIAHAGTLDAPDHSFRFAVANARQRDQLTYYARVPWLRGARFLVSTGPIFEEETQPRRIIAVCDTPYRNIPRHWIAPAPPSHAVAYADGSLGLISAAEFAALDRSTFTPLDELYPPVSQ